MKLRTKLIISFCIIIFVPVTLAALAMCGFRYFQLRDIANTYQVEDGNISYLTNTGADVEPGDKGQLSEVTGYSGKRPGQIPGHEIFNAG